MNNYIDGLDILRKLNRVDTGLLRFVNLGVILAQLSVGERYSLA